MGLQVLYCWGLELSGPISMSLDPWGVGGGARDLPALKGGRPQAPATD